MTNPAHGGEQNHEFSVAAIHEVCGSRDETDWFFGNEQFLSGPFQQSPSMGKFGGVEHALIGAIVTQAANPSLWITPKRFVFIGQKIRPAGFAFDEGRGPVLPADDVGSFTGSGSQVGNDHCAFFPEPRCGVHNKQRVHCLLAVLCAGCDAAGVVVAGWEIHGWGSGAGVSGSSRRRHMVLKAFSRRRRKLTGSSRVRRQASDSVM